VRRMTISPLALPFPEMPAVPGVRVAVARARYKDWDRCDLTFAAFDEGTAVAGVTTKSKCPSPEVEWCRNALTLGRARALVVNAGNSNAFTGSRGRAAVEAIAARVAGAIGCQPSDVFVASTGVIGVPLPIDKAEAGIDAVLEAPEASWREATDAIGTTDTFAKGASGDRRDRRTDDHVGRHHQGIGHDRARHGDDARLHLHRCAIEPALLQQMLDRANAKTFSCITVDGDTSTSDTVLAFATGKAGNAPARERGRCRCRRARGALTDLCRTLAQLVVRDGEGATKFIAVTVEGAESDRAAHRIAMSIANSPLVKTAIAGEDANWGRVVMAVGKAGEPAERDKLAIRFGATQVARDGLAVEGYDEAPVAAHLKGQEIEIGVDLGLGDGRATVWTCDLTHGYISINADYRS
jgi:glutamate N-acetyltransferase/amino-acid N-acetyltransferase